MSDKQYQVYVKEQYHAGYINSTVQYEVARVRGLQSQKTPMASQLCSFFDHIFSAAACITVDPETHTHQNGFCSYIYKLSF